MKKVAKPSRRLITVQMNLAEIDSLPPLLRARVIDRAARKSVKEYKHSVFMDALDCEEDP